MNYYWVYCYHPPTKLREGNVFSCVCSRGRGGSPRHQYQYLDPSPQKASNIQGPPSLPKLFKLVRTCLPLGGSAFWQTPPESEKRMVRNLLECFLVFVIILCMHVRQCIYVIRYNSKFEKEYCVPSFFSVLIAD